MNLKEKLLVIKKYILKNKTIKKEEVRKDTITRKTSLGCMSYEYLKIIKKYQIINGRKNENYYLYLLLFFVCKIKIMISGKNLNKFDDYFRKGDFPTPIKCQKYIYCDGLNFINDVDNVINYIIPLCEDEKIIKYVCDTYGILSVDELKNKYENDDLIKNLEYWDNIDLGNTNLIDTEKKDYMIKVLKRFEGNL